MSASEVARLLAEISLQCEAARNGLNGYAETARHEIIARRYNAIGECQDKLAELIGASEAERMTVLTYIQAMGDDAFTT